MIIAHRDKLIARPIGKPSINRISSSGLSIPGSLSGRVWLINSGQDIALWVPIFPSLRFEVRFSAQNSDSARSVPDAGIDSSSRLMNCIFSKEYSRRHFLLAGLHSLWWGKDKGRKREGAPPEAFSQEPGGVPVFIIGLLFR